MNQIGNNNTKYTFVFIVEEYIYYKTVGLESVTCDWKEWLHVSATYDSHFQAFGVILGYIVTK